MMVQPRDVANRLAAVGHEAGERVHQVASALDDRASDLATAAIGGVESVLPHGRRRRIGWRWGAATILVVVAVAVWRARRTREGADVADDAPVEPSVRASAAG